MTPTRSGFAPALFARVLQRVRVAIRYARLDPFIDFGIDPRNRALADRHAVGEPAFFLAFVNFGAV